MAGNSASNAALPRWISRPRQISLSRLIAAHLKSRRPVPDADEAEERLAEAKILRGIVDERFQADPNARLIVLGDFNDVKDSDSVKEHHRPWKIQAHRHAARRAQRRQRARGKFQLRSAQRGLDGILRQGGHLHPHGLHFVSVPALARDWVKEETYIPTIPNWGVGSDHRPIIAAFKSGRAD